jgi:hypothetical protein
MAKENKPQVSLKKKSLEDGSESKPTVSLQEMSYEQSAESRPSLLPPTLREETGTTSFGAGWYSSKRITGLWSINQNRNSWIGISDIGWRRLGNASDTGVVALTALASHALEKASAVNVLEEDGLITQLYVW